MNTEIKANDRFDRLCNLDISTHYRDIKFYVSSSYLLAAFAYWVVAQNPNKELITNAIEEVDWSVGEILKSVKAAGLSENTLVIFTSDNPRSESPQEIISEMEVGVEPQNFKKTMSIIDRKQAIKTACQLANPNDIILVAGKGHETYQEINGKRIDFDDYKIIEEIFKQLQK